jgi:hypothetical protein
VEIEAQGRTSLPSLRDLRLPPGPLAAQQGVYCFCLAGQIVYVGRSRISFAERISQGYGTIHPQHCYLGGPLTQCRLNILIAQATQTVSCFVLPLREERARAYWERRLISFLQPAWNVGR